MRFGFGKNWKNFLKHLTDERIQAAEQSLRERLDRESLRGETFLDIGCGSGLFSLAARRLGATVVSFDYDRDSVACCEELRKLHFPEDPLWTISAGSILDREFLRGLAPAEVVYSWGVLHHTGSMWEAVENTLPLVKPGGQLVIALYNDQGGASRRWRLVKRLYNAAPWPIPFLMTFVIGGWMEFKQMLIRLVRLRNPLPFADWKQRGAERGMSYWHDLVDWLGGYPFEVAKPDEVFRFVHARGFELIQLKTVLNGYGCNEFVFRNRSG